jgi:hypothetical protein
MPLPITQSKESMTKKEFETYRFGINTRVKHEGKWLDVSEVDFCEGWIGIVGTDYSIHYSKVEEIKENK